MRLARRERAAGSGPLKAAVRTVIDAMWAQEPDVIERYAKGELGPSSIAVRRIARLCGVASG